MVLPPGVALAAEMAERRLGALNTPGAVCVTGPRLSAVLMTLKTAGTHRSSRASRPSRVRRRAAVRSQRPRAGGVVWEGRRPQKKERQFMIQPPFEKGTQLCGDDDVSANNRRAASPA